MCDIDSKIKNVILNSGIGYSELARRCGVERSAVGKWAKTGKITLQNFSRLCAILNLDADEMLNLKKQQTNDEITIAISKLSRLKPDDPRIDVINLILSLDVKH